MAAPKLSLAIYNDKVYFLAQTVVNMIEYKANQISQYAEQQSKVGPDRYADDTAVWYLLKLCEEFKLQIMEAYTWRGKPPE